ncbi:hypothetical protein [Actinoalloteichus spitiensis]|uniref:hypothetical protein n=1 Tax=Actinoalloteichus spitiensis TaxID=252394 RepID=UPI000365A3F7|nr:hypothetical protein [Actinoalloteichus spitiensis]
MTSPGFDQDSWKTPQVRAAEARLGEAMARSRELIRELERLQPPTPPQVTEADVRQMEEAAKRVDADPAMRELQARVEAGTLSWRDVLEGRAYDDPDVRRALESQMTEMRDIFQQFEEGYTLDEVIEARRQAENGEDGGGGGGFLR